MTDHASVLECYRKHVWEGQRCTECGVYHVAIRPEGASPAWSECTSCGEMACEPISPAFEFPYQRGKSVYKVARDLGLKV